MGDVTARFFDVFEEVTSAALARPGGRPRESRERAISRAAEGDGPLDVTDGDVYDDLRRIRDLIAHARHRGQTLVTASDAAVDAALRLREKLVGSLPTVGPLCNGVLTIEPDATLADACAYMPPLFTQVGPTGCPVGAVLITNTGHSHEPLLGILTPWDLPAVAR